MQHDIIQGNSGVCATRIDTTYLMLYYIIPMENTLLQKLARCKANAEEALSRKSAEERSQLEKAWDVEHAYYSSVLEGTKIDKKEFEELGKSVE